MAHEAARADGRHRRIQGSSVSRSPNHLDRRGLTWGAVGVAIVIALTFIGSDRLVWFDAALVGYLFGVVFAVFGVAYRYAVWLRRPPTAMLNRRGWDAFRQRKARNAAALPSLVANHLLAQGFIRRGSHARWLAHQLVFWECILAGLVTIPLALGTRRRRGARPRRRVHLLAPPTARPGSNGGGTLR